MKVKVSEATNLQLDWMVAKCEGWDGYDVHSNGAFKLERSDTGECIWLRCFTPTTDWSQGGPIFSEAGIGAEKAENDCDWVAMRRYTLQRDDAYWCGPTELIAKARCFVAFRLGEEVEVPEELT